MKSNISDEFRKNGMIALHRTFIIDTVAWDIIFLLSGKFKLKQNARQAPGRYIIFNE